MSTSTQSLEKPALMGRNHVSSTNTIICGKRCFNTSQDTANQTKSKRLYWHNDGPTENVNSESILLDWLTTQGNYEKWKGGAKNSGDTKKTLASQISSLMKDKGVLVTRNAKNIIDKVGHIERTFKEASDWLRQTGQGVEDEESIKKAVLKRCCYYYTIKDIMIDRPSITPLATEDDLDASVSQSSHDSEDEANLASTDSKLDKDVVANSTEYIDTSTSNDMDSILSPRYKTSDIEQTSSRITVAHSSSKKRKSRSKTQEVEQFTNLENLKKQELEMNKKYKNREIEVKEKEVNALATKLEEETKDIIQKRKYNLALQRLDLRSKGVPEEEINELLPLK